MYVRLGICRDLEKKEIKGVTKDIFSEFTEYKLKINLTQL